MSTTLKRILQILGVKNKRFKNIYPLTFTYDNFDHRYYKTHLNSSNAQWGKTLQKNI